MFNSSKIPGEIIDMLVVNTETLKDNPTLGKALVGIWYETMALMRDPGEDGKAAREAMAEASGTDLAGFEAQLQHDPHVLRRRAKRSPSRRAPIWSRPWSSCALLLRAQSARRRRQEQGRDRHRVPRGKTLGRKNNIKLRFDASLHEMAADGKL